jgi:hypothetical protein
MSSYRTLPTHIHIWLLHEDVLKIMSSYRTLPTHIHIWLLHEDVLKIMSSYRTLPTLIHMASTRRCSQSHVILQDLTYSHTYMASTRRCSQSQVILQDLTYSHTYMAFTRRCSQNHVIRKAERWSPCVVWYYVTLTEMAWDYCTHTVAEQGAGVLNLQQSRPCWCLSHAGSRRWKLQLRFVVYAYPWPNWTSDIHGFPPVPCFTNRGMGSYIHKLYYIIIICIILYILFIYLSNIYMCILIYLFF